MARASVSVDITNFSSDGLFDTVYSLDSIVHVFKLYHRLKLHILAGATLAVALEASTAPSAIIHRLWQQE